MKKRLNLFTLLIALPVCALCQVPQYGSLVPGDRMPDVMLRNIANYETDSARISDFRGKLLIFDFWTVYCPSCIRSMPHMEALQERFGDQIQIILVTDSKPHEVYKLMERSDIVRNVNLPSIVGDTILTQLFQFRTVPTHVWIDERGYVAQFTGPYTDVASIGDHLDGKLVNFPVKKEYRDFDMMAPLMEEGKGRQVKHLQYYSALFGKIDDGGSMTGAVFDKTSKHAVGYKLVNQPLINLYSYAYASKDIPVGDYSRIVVESNHPDLTEAPESDDSAYPLWVQEHYYSYESRVPDGSKVKLKAIMQQDLKRWFGLKVKIEQREVKCLVLTCTDTTLLDNRYPDDVQELPASQYKTLVVNMQDATQFCGLLGDYLRYTLKRPMPIIHEIDYAGKVRFKLQLPLDGDFESLEQAIAVHGLTLREETRELDMVIIHD